MYIQELWFLRSARRRMLVDISVKFREYILNGFHVTERTRFCLWNCYLPSSKGRNSKIYIHELWFLRLMLVNISFTFHENILNGFQVTERTALNSVLGIATATYKSQRGITQKMYIQALWFLRSAHRLMLINISMTFHEDILNGFQVTKRKALYSVLGIAIFFSSLGITSSRPNSVTKRGFLYTRLDKLSLPMQFHQVILYGSRVMLIFVKWFHIFHEQS